MTRLTVLMDNQALPGFESEWGFSLALTLDDGSLWLWDTGASEAFINNAERLHLNLGQACGLALSHGHWDHTGGLDSLTRTGFGGPVFMHPAGLAQRWTRRESKSERVEEIGIRSTLPEIVPVMGPMDLAFGLTMVSDIQRIPGRHQATQNFYLDLGLTLPDPVRDDAFLLLRSGTGDWAMVLGCCHAGLANSLESAARITQQRRIRTVVGGLHLFDAHDRTIRETIESLKEFGVERLLVGHCTGDNGMQALAESMQDCSVVQTRAGMSVELFAG